MVLSIFGNFWGAKAIEISNRKFLCVNSIQIERQVYLRIDL